MAKNRLIFSMVLIAMLTLLFLQESPMTYFALYATLILPLLSLALTLVSRLRTNYFTISETLEPNYVPKGEEVLYKIRVTNNSFLPYIGAKIRFQPESPALTVDCPAQYFSVRPKSSHDILFPISAKFRGNYEIGVKSITLYDFLGLFRFKQKLGEKRIFTVVPRIYPISFLPLDSTSKESVSAKHYIQDEDYGTVSDLRQYQLTDSHKRIHWKASAKKNELISKNFEEMEQNSVVLCIDTTETSLALEDAMMEALVSAMAYCNQQGCPITLLYSGSKDAGFSTNFHQLYTEAANIRFQASEVFDDYFNLSTFPHKESMNLILFVQHVTEGLLFFVQSFRQLGNQVILFYPQDQVEAEHMKRLRDYNVCCIDLHTFSL